jgi:hypothetical protein
MRVTLTKRRCPQCGTPITPEEIDRQAAERARNAAFDLGFLVGVILLFILIFTFFASR